MDGASRVHWFEGMFLRAQHFQQLERHADAVLAGSLRGVAGLGWGFRRLAIDPTLLKDGMVSLLEAEGILPDGSYFELDAETRPEPLEIGPTTPAGVVRFVLPPRSPDQLAVDEPDEPETGARYRSALVKVRDTATRGAREAEIKVCRPRFRLIHESDVQGGLVSLGVLRVVGRSPQKEVLRDADWLPPALTIAAEAGYVDILRAVEARARKLVERRRPFVQGAIQHGAGTTNDMFAVSIAQRAQRQAAHMLDQALLHPERLYEWMTGLVGELLLLVPPDFREPPVEPYRHENPGFGLRSLAALLEAIFSTLDGERRPFRELELHKHSAGLVYTTINVAGEVFARSELVLAARAEVEPRRMRDELPRQTVLGPVEEFDDLWYSRIAGVPLQWRERAPRVLPFMDGFSFYDLDRNNPYWQRVTRSESLAIGIDGEWPSLQLRLFALLPEG